MTPKLGQVTEISFEGTVNGIADIVDEREMGLVKMLRGLSASSSSAKPVRQNIRADNLRLLEISAYGDIYRELKPEQFFESSAVGKNVLKICSHNVKRRTGSCYFANSFNLL
ncbi:hypothetical protein RvY_03156 [Ramazzottius varieornatus]|uniref:Uncharacterized protein n=1 Tax=Ramazzottius varieornatus TaxID=947166 RepID=A0A1D1UM32_RAMVA|nr:hypothetical protein RvY_03156 [Ramazzottius varieornatus]